MNDIHRTYVDASARTDAPSPRKRCELFVYFFFVSIVVLGLMIPMHYAVVNLNALNLLFKQVSRINLACHHYFDLFTYFLQNQ